MQIEPDLKLDFADVLIRPKRSKLTSRNEVQLQRTFSMPNANKEWHGVPIVAANMDTVGTFEMAEALSLQNMMTALHKHYTEDELVDFFINVVPARNIDLNCVMYTVGMTQPDFDKLVNVEHRIRNFNPDFFPFPKWLCIDVANGYMERLVEAVERYRYTFPQSIIVAGNVVTAEMTEALILAGADIVKVGIGSGSACTTRNKTGIGYPQLSAVMECADAAHGAPGGHIMSDGGCQEVGDIAKALGAGADFVMLGGMLAGHDECETKEFYGMSSREAQERHHGGVALYRATEGKKVEVPDRGPVENTLQEILGGLRSCCTYVGAKYLKHLPKCTTFVRVSRQEG